LRYGLELLPGPGLNHYPPTFASQVAKITGMPHHTQSSIWRERKKKCFFLCATQLILIILRHFASQINALLSWFQCLSKTNKQAKKSKPSFSWQKNRSHHLLGKIFWILTSIYRRPFQSFSQQCLLRFVRRWALQVQKEIECAFRFFMSLYLCIFCVFPVLFACLFTSGCYHHTL
jgi:hypothetical protein